MDSILPPGDSRVIAQKNYASSGHTYVLFELAAGAHHAIGRYHGSTSQPELFPQQPEEGGIDEELFAAHFPFFEDANVT